MGNNASYPGGLGSMKDLTSLRPESSLSDKIGLEASPKASPRIGIKFKSNKYSPQIVRVINSAPNLSPDVESLGVSFEAARMILIPLSLADLNSCMRVCKEWRSLIDTCAFWRFYLDYHYGFNICSPRGSSAFHAWKYKPDCLQISTKKTNQNLKDEATPEFVFKPFPDLWKCGVVVPYATTPASGSLQMYHSFVKALRVLEIMQERLREFKMGRNIKTCLFPWNRPHFPHPKQVLDTFNANREVIRTCMNGSSLTKQEFASFYTLLTNGDGKRRFDQKFYQSIVALAGQSSLVFDCCPRVVDPTPCFIVTELSPGWLGGLLYAS